MEHQDAPIEAVEQVEQSVEKVVAVESIANPRRIRSTSTVQLTDDTASAK